MQQRRQGHIEGREDSRRRGLKNRNLGALKSRPGRTLGEADSTNERPARLQAAAEVSGGLCAAFRVGSSPWGASEEASDPHLGQLSSALKHTFSSHILN